MTIQLSVAVRNARLDAVETAIGASAKLQIRSGAPPANCASANSGTLLAAIDLPADWMAAAANGQKDKLGSWVDSSADATGTAGHYRIFANDGTTCHMQGTVTATSGGGDMEVDNTSFNSGQQFSVTSFTLNEPNA